LHKNSTYTRQIKTEALRLGFNDCGISRAEVLTEDFKRLKVWLRKNYQAELTYMERNAEKRKDIRKLVDGARSVISVILCYYPPEQQKYSEAPILSKYAYGRDYHTVIKDRLNQLMEFIREIIPGAEGREFVDSAPVLEHAWASRAGLGWIGKNSLLISKRYGSFIFLAELVVNVELDYDNPVRDMCGSCRKCLDSCPTGAINEGRMVDAGKCISYYTIENKTGSMPEELKHRFMNRVFGCDICQDVCPWNRKIQTHNVKEFYPHPDLLSMNRMDWYSLDRERFDELFENSAVMRAGYDGLMRNLNFIK
jgi:epoxyqueuosine reductase